MSNIITVDSKSATISARQVKTFSAFKIEPFIHSLVFGKGLTPTDTIKPSDIGMNGSTAKSSLGAAVSVPGFITGLAWSVCALAHGQRKLAALVENLPSASAFAVTHAASLIKPGAGISAGSLETVLIDSLKSMLALPAPTKRIADKVTTEADTASESASEADTASESASESASEPASEADTASEPASEADTASESASEADTAAAAAAEQEPNFVRSFTAMSRDDAEKQLKAIALALGYRLVRIKTA